MDFSVMGPAAVVVVAGGVLAVLASSRSQKTDASIDEEAQAIDLQSTRDEAMAALKQLELDRHKLSEADFQAERQALLARGANALRALSGAPPTTAPSTAAALTLSSLPDLPMPDGTEPVLDNLRDLLDEHGAARFRAAMVALAKERPKAVVPQLLADGAAAAPTPSPSEEGATAPAQPPRAPAAVPAAPEPSNTLSPEYKGALIMLGLLVIVGTFVYFAQQGSVVRRDGAGMTGNQELGAAPAPAAPMAPQAPPEAAALEAKLAANPNDIEALSDLTELYLAIGDAGKAMEYNNKAKEVAPDHPDTRTFQAVLRAMVGMFPPAIEALEAVVADHPDHPQAWTYLGLIQYDKGDKARGLEALTKAVELQPDNPGLVQALERAKRGEPLTGGPPPPPPAQAPGAAGAGEVIVSGRAELAPGEVVKGTEVVFVSIKDPARPGPPVAAKKYQASQLPLDFVVTTADQISMGGAPGPLPPNVSVTIRVDADGDGSAFTKTPIDPTGVLDSVAVGSTGLELKLTKP